MFRLLYSLTLSIKLVTGVLPVQIANIAQIRARLIAAERNNVPTFVSDTRKMRLNSSSRFSSLFYSLSKKERKRDM